MDPKTQKLVLDTIVKKIEKCHDLMDAAGVLTEEGTHPQLVPRLEMLIAERDRLRSLLKEIDAWVDTGTYGKYLPLPLYSRIKEALKEK